MKYFYIILMLIIINNLNISLFSNYGYYNNQAMMKLIDIQILENEHIVLKNKRLEKDIINLKNGYEIIEEKARIELGMIKKGEKFYRIIEK